MKFPGVYFAYAILMAVFGQTIGGIHFGFLLCNAATIVLMFLLGKRLLGPAAGVTTAGVYGLLSLSAGVVGTSAHATHFVVFAAVGATLLLLRSIEDHRARILFASGFLFGVAVLMKQHGALFAVFGTLWLVAVTVRRAEARKERLRRLGTFAAGFLIPILSTASALWIVGVFPKFWFWTFTYAREYVSEVSLTEGLGLFTAILPRVTGPTLPLWICAALGFGLIWWKGERRTAIFLTGFLLFSFLAISPGLYFREHYFVLLLPVVALLVGATVPFTPSLIGDVASVCVFGAILSISIYLQSDFLFKLSPLEAARLMFTFNPFPEAVQVGEYLRNHVPRERRIAVLGSEPEIYFYADRRSATGYIYTYGMMEPQPYALTMQNDLIHDIETTRPEYVVQVNSPASWLIRPTSSSHIFEWWRAERSRFYRRIGIANVISGNETQYRWGDVPPLPDESGVIIEVFEIKR